MGSIRRYLQYIRYIIIFTLHRPVYRQFSNQTTRMSIAVMKICNMSTAGTQTIYRILVESTNLTGHGFYCHGMIIVSSHTSYRRDQWYWVVLGSYGSDPSLTPRLNPNCLVELGFKSYMWHTIRGLSLRTSVVTFISARL